MMFTQMFSDSNIVKEFCLGYDNSSYIISFRLTLYFEKILNVELKCLRMDIHVCYWDATKDIFVARYFQSEFLSHGKADDLVSNFCTGLKSIS